MKINNETKRILKALFTMRGEVSLNDGVFGTSISYEYNDMFVNIDKSEDGVFYEIEQIYKFDDGVIGVKFTTVSSLINYLKNNFQ